MKQYVSPTIEFISFEREISIQTNDSTSCNCAAQQYSNNTSLEGGCELTTYAFNEIGNFYD